MVAKSRMETEMALSKIKDTEFKTDYSICEVTDYIQETYSKYRQLYLNENSKNHNFDINRLVSSILDKNPDMIVTCAYGQIIPKELIEYPKYGCINVHGSLLPKLRGGAPIHWAIINGEKETGMTVMRMSEKMDAGDIISQGILVIGEDEILDSLYERMSILGRDLLLETIPDIVDGIAQYVPQNESDVTFGFNVRREDEKIDFKKSSIDIKNLVRGLNSVPGAYTILDGKRMKIYQVSLLDNNYSNGKCGEIVAVEQDGMIVQCGDGFVKILDIALEGRKRCLVKDYFNGVRKESLIGKVFE